jgi:hypothetical protein
MDYVSCSPFRVPIARLAAAQAQIEIRAARKLSKRKWQTAPVERSASFVFWV